MDAESCACGAGKGKKCSCDGGCGSYKKMDSALTPHEYLDACELGIQDRSRSYIRTHLVTMDSALLRTDKKCGNSSIPDNKQCRAGGGGTLRRVATGAAIAGGVAAAAYGASRMRRGGARALAPSGGVSSLTRGNSLGNRARRAAYGASTRVRSAAGSAASRVRSAASGTRGANWTRANSPGNLMRRAQAGAGGMRRSATLYGRRARRSVQSRFSRDSVWAVGFEPVGRIDKKCGNGAISENETCRSGAGAPARPSIGRGAAKGAKIGAVLGGGLGLIHGANVSRAMGGGVGTTLASAALGAGAGAASHALYGAGIGAGVNAIRKANYNRKYGDKRKQKAGMR